MSANASDDGKPTDTGNQVDIAILNAILNATDTMLVYLDREFNFVVVNAAYAKACRMLPEAMIGKNHFALYPNLENEAIFRMVLDTGEPVSFQDRRYTCSDQEHGTTYWDWSLTPVKNACGAVTGLVLSLRETTRNKVAEETLRNSERLYRAIGESIDYGVWVCAPDGRNVYASDSFLKLVGITQQQCSDFGWGEVLHPEDAEHTIRAWKECASTGGNWDIEHRFKGVDGQWHSVLARGVPVRDNQGQITCWAGINLDISRLKRAEEQAQWQNAMLQGINRILERALRSKTLRDLGQTCLAVAREITQSKCGFIDEINADGKLENIAVSDPDCSHGTLPAGRGRVEDGGVFWRILKDGKALFTNNPAEDPDALFPAGHGSLTAFLGAPLTRDGQTIGIIAVGNREGGYSPRELEALEALAPVVVEAFANRRAKDALYTAKAEAEESNRAKDRFLALLGHELRNPLAPIRNSVALLKRLCPPDPALQRAQEMIERQVHQMSRLTDDLLDVSRIASGKITLRKNEIDLTEVVRCTVEDHRALLESKGLALAYRGAETGIAVIGDQARMSQVIGNLLQNSAKFVDRGGHVAVEVHMHDSRHAVITVSDDGIGMDPATLGKIFQPFAQADNSLERSAGGLGLGLALAKGIVELHGGSIRAASAGIGLGSTFTVIVPGLLRSVAPATVSAAPPAAAPSLKVLVIEDNEDSAESLKILLEVSGHHVAVATAGREGLATARREHPDVVLCDIGLPEMDGYAVATELRNDPQLRSAYLVAMTGYGLEDDKEQARRAGFDTHMTKPANFDQLERLLAKIATRIGKSGAASEA